MILTICWIGIRSIGVVASRCVTAVTRFYCYHGPCQPLRRSMLQLGMTAKTNPNMMFRWMTQVSCGSGKGKHCILLRLRAYRPPSQNFSVCWSISEFPTDLTGCVILDGPNVGGYPRGWKKAQIISYCYASNTTTRNFSFSAISFTGSSFSCIYPLFHLTLVFQTMMRISILLWYCTTSISSCAAITEQKKVTYGMARLKMWIRPTRKKSMDV